MLSLLQYFSNWLSGNAPLSTFWILDSQDSRKSRAFVLLEVFQLLIQMPPRIGISICLMPIPYGPKATSKDAKLRIYPDVYWPGSRTTSFWLQVVCLALGLGIQNNNNKLGRKRVKRLKDLKEFLLPKDLCALVSVATWRASYFLQTRTGDRHYASRHALGAQWCFDGCFSLLNRMKENKLQLAYLLFNYI